MISAGKIIALCLNSALQWGLLLRGVIMIFIPLAESNGLSYDLLS